MKKHLFALTAVTIFAMAAGSATAEARLRTPPMAHAGYHIVNDICDPRSTDCNAAQAFAQGALAGLGGIVGMVGGPIGAILMAGLGAL